MVEAILHRRLARFLLVGGTTYLLTMFSFQALHAWCRWAPNLAATVSYLTGVVYHFAMNRAFTFRSHDESVAPQICRYAVLVGVNYLLTFLLFRLLIAHAHMWPLLSFAISVTVTTATGYMAMNLWVFARRTHPSRTAPDLPVGR